MKSDTNPKKCKAQKIQKQYTVQQNIRNTSLLHMCDYFPRVLQGGQKTGTSVIVRTAAVYEYVTMSKFKTQLPLVINC